MGARFCDGAHYFGSGTEFASWDERTQHVYANMARMDHEAFSKPPYNARYRCTPKNTHPVYWSSELTQACRFHSNQLAVFDTMGHQTPEENKDLFGNDGSFFARVAKFTNSIHNGVSENVVAGVGSPLGATTTWLTSPGHCANMIHEDHIFMGAGFAYYRFSNYKWYATNVFTGAAKSPTQDIVAGSHDVVFNKNRFLVQVHMSQAPSKVSVVVGGTTKTMALLMGTAKSGTYYVDVDTFTGAEIDGCVPYYFEVNSNAGSSRMPKDKSFHFLTFGIKNCKRNIGTTAKQPSGNVCSCPNGKPRTGATCTTNNAVLCASCDAGFTLRLNKCVKNTCACPNGTPKANCPIDRAIVCDSCQQKTGETKEKLGYVLKKAIKHYWGAIGLLKKVECVIKYNDCTCPNGRPKKNLHCTTDKALMCAICEKGYTLQNNA